MPPLARTRSSAASIPVLVSLSKLLHVAPKLYTNKHAKRGAEWAAATAAGAVIALAEEEDAMPESQFISKLILSAAFVLLGGVFAGLTLALMGSDDLNLRVLATSSSDPKTRAAASKVLRLLGKGRHWVLVVLLLSNVIVNESLPIFLDDVLGGGVRAVVVSTVMIVIFGEVIPQAVCVRYGLAIGGACAPMVHALMILFAPIAWPIAKLLDWILGTEEGHTYKKAELKSFLQFHRYGEEPLRDDEIVILNGVLSLNDRQVKEIMTPIEDCLTLPANQILDHETIDRILMSGFSRIPIYEPNQEYNFIGMLLVKRLITYNPDEELPVSAFPLHALPEAKPDLNCFQALDYFQTGRAHLLLISETPGQRGGALGVISLEDLIEEIIGEEIIDETDMYQDNRSKRKAQRKATAGIMRGIIERQKVAQSRRQSGQFSGSRDPSPYPQPREGVLVNLTDGPISSSPLRHFELPPDSSPALGITIVETTPSGEVSDIQQPVHDTGVVTEVIEPQLEAAKLDNVKASIDETAAKEDAVITEPASTSSATAATSSASDSVKNNGPHEREASATSTTSTTNSNSKPKDGNAPATSNGNTGSNGSAKGNQTGSKGGKNKRRGRKK